MASSLCPVSFRVLFPSSLSMIIFLQYSISESHHNVYADFAKRNDVGAIIHYALVRLYKRCEGVMNYSPYIECINEIVK